MFWFDFTIWPVLPNKVPFGLVPYTLTIDSRSIYLDINWPEAIIENGVPGVMQGSQSMLMVRRTSFSAGSRLFSSSHRQSWEEF